MMHGLQKTWGIWVLALLIFGAPLIVTEIFPAPIHFTVLPLPVEPSGVHGGDLMTLYVSRCNDTPFSIVYTTTWQLVRESDDLRILLPNGGRTAEPGCISYHGMIQLVPTGTPSGRYHVTGAISYPTPWRDYTSAFTTESFTVLP